jgi:hypothetical protein
MGNPHITCSEGRDMKRLCVLLCAVFLGLGCSSDADKAQWEEVWKDLRGDNMKMKHNFPGTKDEDAPR